MFCQQMVQHYHANVIALFKGAMSPICIHGNVQTVPQFCNNPTSTQKIVLIIFGCGWLGLKWIIAYVLPVYFGEIAEKIPDYSLFFPGEINIFSR